MLTQLTANGNCSSSRGNLSTDPDDTLSAAAIDSLHSNIDDAVDKRFLTPDAALAEKKRAALRLTAAHYRKMATENPARAIDELTAEESPHPLVKHFAGDTRDALLTLAQDNLTAREVDAERNSALAAKAQEATADQAEQTYVDEAITGTPDLAGRIANDGALTPESRSRLFLTLRRTAQPDPPAEVSRPTAVALLASVGQDDPASILDAYNNGKLSAVDYRSVTKQLTQVAGTEPTAPSNSLIRVGGNRRGLDPRDFLDFLGPVRTLQFNSLRTRVQEIQPRNYVLTTPSLHNPGGYPTRDELAQLVIARRVARIYSTARGSRPSDLGAPRPTRPKSQNRWSDANDERPFRGWERKYWLNVCTTPSKAAWRSLVRKRGS